MAKVDKWARLDIPDHHSLVVSLPYVSTDMSDVKCTQSGLQLWIGNDTATRAVLKGCGAFLPPPAVYHTRVLHVRVINSQVRLT